jgi:hypothetical protein
MEDFLTSLANIVIVLVIIFVLLVGLGTIFVKPPACPASSFSSEVLRCEDDTAVCYIYQSHMECYKK